MTILEKLLGVIGLTTKARFDRAVRGRAEEVAIYSEALVQTEKAFDILRQQNRELRNQNRQLQANVKALGKSLDEAYNLLNNPMGSPSR